MSALRTLTYVRQRKDIVAIALLTREDIRTLGSALKLVYRAEDSDRFDDLLRAFDQPLASSSR